MDGMDMDLKATLRWNFRPDMPLKFLQPQRKKTSWFSFTQNCLWTFPRRHPLHLNKYGGLEGY